MKGIIEIHNSNGLLLISENINVDGAGESIADFMVLSPDIADISSASALLDTSNYTIQAITFGKDSYAYSQNAHNANVVSSVNTLFGGIPIEIATSSYSGSAVNTVNSLPVAVSPIDTKLQTVSSTTGILGHNLNYTNYYVELVLNGLILSVQQAVAAGCYPYKTSGITTLNLYNPSTSSMDASSTGLHSNFNLVSSMDYKGYCKVVSGTDTSAGLIVSAVSDDEVAYQVTICSGDVASCDFYGGITTVGLWLLDLSATLALGNPPFEFDPITLKRAYKLHSKKVFSTNIVNNSDATLPGIEGYADLLLTWRLKF